jgi:hypothetical protein
VGAADDGALLSVAHVSWNHPWAHREVEITVDLVGGADDGSWGALLEQVSTAVREPIWEASRAAPNERRGDSSSTT